MQRYMPILMCLLVLGTFAVPVSGTTTARLLNNINPNQYTEYNNLSYPGIPKDAPMANLGGKLLFVNTYPKYQSGLWISDGTSTGMQLLYDIAPTVVPYPLETLAILGNRAFYLANSSLWATDGTTAGTILFRTIETHTSSGATSVPRMISADTLIYFVALDNNTPSLWRTDGTQNGTIKLYDGISIPSDAFTATTGSVLYWTRITYNPLTTTLWRSDGTTAGTGAVAAIDPPLAAHLSRGAVIGNTVYFLADGTSGVGLWKSNGTSAGTSFVRAFSNPRSLVSTGTTLFLSTADGNQPVTSQIWKSNGTNADSQIVASYTNQFNRISIMQAVAERLYYADPTGQVYSTNGYTPEALATAMLTGDSKPHFVAHNGAVYFLDSRGAATQLWKTNGTNAGTQALVYANGSNLISVGTRLHFVQFNFTDTDGRLWQTDGTQASTHSSQDASWRDNSATIGVMLPKLLAVGNQFYLAANDGNHGVEPWKSDGTSTGTQLLADIRADSPFNKVGSNPSELTNYQGSLVFLADDGRGPALWKSDGTTIGTQVVKLFDGEDDSGRIIQLHNTLYITTYRSFLLGSITKLWQSDGTEAGTQIFAPNLSIQNIALSGDKLYLVASDSATHTSGLWVSDGTVAGTQLLADAAAPVTMIPNNGNLYFTVQVQYAYDLWKTDGTTAGTQRVASLPSVTNTKPNYFTIAGERLFFALETLTNGEELWVSDGSTAGTHIVRNIATDGANAWQRVSSSPRLLTALGNQLLFSADDAIHGRELWISDGTEAGTQMVADLRPGPLGGFDDPTTPLDANYSNPWSVIDGSIYFSANDGLHGFELWKSDGTETGTEMLTDIVPGPGSSHPFGTIRFGTKLFFFADDSITGAEIWTTSEDVPADPFPYKAYLPNLMGP